MKELVKVVAALKKHVCFKHTGGDAKPVRVQSFVENIVSKKPKMIIALARAGGI